MGWWAVRGHQQLKKVELPKIGLHSADPVPSRGYGYPSFLSSQPS